MEIEIIFEVKRILYRDIKTGYTVAKIYIKSHPASVDIPTIDTVATGNFPVIHISDEFKATGSWVNNKKYGYNFKIDKTTLMLPETEKGMIDFLSKIVKGVGKRTAQNIVKEFKADSFNIVMSSPEKLSIIKGLNDEKIEKLHSQLVMYKDFEEVATFLIPLGLNHTQSVEIYDKFGYSSISIIKKNPYILLDHTKLPFRTIDRIARDLGFSHDNKKRIETGLLLAIKESMNYQGNMFIYKEELLNNLSIFLINTGAYDFTDIVEKEQIEDAMLYLTQMKKIKIAKDKNNTDCVYVSYYKYVEDEIVRYITQMNNMLLFKTYNRSKVEDFIGAYQSNTGITLADKQKKAVLMAMDNKISILSGGPGTGKTQTINTIIECLSTLDSDTTIELTAPTGRASKRITELTGRKAKTIHRLIGLKAGEHDEELIPIESDFLIIDEASMIDAYVFFKLLSAVSERTRVLIVGDYNQLPSVGPGLILRDIINSKTVNTTILTEIFRQAQDSQIVMNCHKLISGSKTYGNNNLTFDVENKDFYFMETKNPEVISTTIIRTIERLIQTGVKFDDIQVLSVMNNGELGVNELNKKIQETFNSRSNSGMELEVGNNRYFRKNDRVMQTVNNYDLEVFNGEVGKIISIINPGTSKLEVVVDFDDREVIYDKDSIIELTLSYAMTVHKSQGSEFKYVIMPFHSSLSILLNRNIIYTGWSRAKERVMCIGDMDELNMGVDRISNLSRNSNILDRLVSSNIIVEEVMYA